MLEVLASTVSWLIVFSNFDDTAATELAELRLRLAERLTATLDSVDAALSQPQLSTDGFSGVVQQLTEALAADESLAANLSDLLDQTMQSDSAAASLVLQARGRSLAAGDCHEEALAAYDEILRRQPDDPDALCWSAMSLLLLDRREEALARLQRASALEATGVINWVLMATQFLKLGERDDATAAATKATRAMELGDSMPLPDQWALVLSRVWAELDAPDQAIAVLEPLLTADGGPSRLRWRPASGLPSCS